MNDDLNNVTDTNPEQSFNSGVTGLDAVILDSEYFGCTWQNVTGGHIEYIDDLEICGLGIYLTVENSPASRIMSKILLVEDDSELAEKIVECLTLDRHFVETANSGSTGFEYLRTYDFDAIILDWHLPEMTGIELCKKHRADGGQTPILMLTGRSGIADKEDGLDAGADDYLTKPFHLRELRARIRALLRRKHHQLQQNNLCINDLVLDRLGHSLAYNGQSIHVSPKEFSLLEFLMSHPEELFSAEALLARVWFDSEDASIATVRAHIKSLRQKLAIVSTISIQTVHGVGYKLRSA